MHLEPHHCEGTEDAERDSMHSLQGHGALKRVKLRNTVRRFRFEADKRCACYEVVAK